MSNDLKLFRNVPRLESWMLGRYHDTKTNTRVRRALGGWTIFRWILQIKDGCIRKMPAINIVFRYDFLEMLQQSSLSRYFVTIINSKANVGMSVGV